MRTTLLCAAALLLALVSALPARAQDAPATMRVPVTVAIVDELPYPDAPFVILRRPAETPRDVILLPRTASPALLSDAVRALALARQQGGDVPRSASVLRLTVPQGRGWERAPLPWVPRVLRDLRRASETTLAGVGRVQAVEIWLPRTIRRRTHP
jgi:hypothetical protein